MICSKCAHWKQTDIRVRYTPTFYHSPIFDSPECQRNVPTKCSATYHSTVFNGAQIHRGTKCCCKDPKLSSKKQLTKTKTNNIQKTTVRCSSASRLHKQADLYPHTHNDLNKLTSRGISNHQLLWYNPDKEVRLMNCSSCKHHGLPKQRKLIELASCPFYTDSEQIKINNNCGVCSHDADNELNNDSLDLINQQAKNNKVYEQTTFGQNKETQVIISPQQQVQVKSGKVNDKIDNRQTKPQFEKTVRKQKKQTECKADAYSKCSRKQELNTINTCNKNIRRTANTNSGNQATGQPMFWAVNKNRCK